VVPQRILADVGERRSGVPDALRELGSDVTLDVLPAGDYIVAPKMLVERKSIADLHRSVATGRLRRQLERLRATADRSWLLVEGPRLDGGQISESGIRGAILAVVETGIPVLWSGSARDSALWLLRLAARADVARPWVMRAPRCGPTPTPVRLLCQIPGVSPRLAGRLLDRFGSVAAIASASEHELTSIEGIGKVRATNIRSSLSGTFRNAESAL
jgi:DNA excision repair protein ERCC-4